MRKNSMPLVCLFAVAAGAAMGQTLPAYLDITKAQIHSERSREYEDGVRKLIEVNRKYKGDRWIALTTEYGDTGTYMFSSSRENLAGVEAGGEVFMKALKEGLGPLGDKLLRDLGAWSTSFRSEIRRRRWDLSVHPPADSAGLSAMVAHARWIRTVKLDLKPGKSMEYIAAWKQFQAELGQVSPPVTALVSEGITGTPVMYVGMYYKSMADMDAEVEGVRKALMSDAYVNLMKISGDAVAMSNWEIHRVRPDLSNPPDEILNADPAFWKTKPPAAAKPKTDAAPEKKTAALR